ncbi:hypothetical protein [Actinoallomurus iriomotensis]|uniref:hypothetical protein n=1 Tax=Actinoallomurus iriomotensis TaxID=478107 RepID=UPI002552D9A7|nr:hypothetical protein [Actinoallomurus iriomotensis]
MDWGSFDIIGLDHSGDRHVTGRYGEILEHWSAKGEPVVVTEFGCRTRTRTGGADPENVAIVSMVRHLVPGVRRPRLAGTEHPASGPCTNATRHTRPKAWSGN